MTRRKYVNRIKIGLTRFPNLYQFLLIIYYKYVRRLDAEIKIKPTSLAIESTNVCNAACTFCPHGDGSNELPKKIMSNQTFFELIDRAVMEGITEFHFGGLGEFLVDKRFIEKAGYISNKGLFFALTTNAMKLDPELTDKLASVNLRSIHISIDSFEKEIYEQIRIRLKYDTVMKNTFYFLEKFLNDSELKTKICINVVLTDPSDATQTVQIYDAFEKYLSSDKFSIVYYPIHNWGGSITRNYDDSVYRNDTNLVKIPCSRLFSSHLLVKVNGELSICCEDYNNIHSLGQLNAKSSRTAKGISFFELWNGSKMRALRKMHIDGRWGEIELCRDCSDNSALTARPYVVDRLLGNMEKDERPWFLAKHL